jgi:integrase
MNTLTPHIHRYLAGRFRRGELAAISARDYRYRLDHLADVHGRRPAAQLGPATIDRWLATIGHRAPATRRMHISTVRGFTGYLRAERVITVDPLAHVPAVRQPRRNPATLTANEVARLLAVAPDNRARAILWLMVGCGCRRIEVVRLRVEDYDPVARTVLLRGKAGHERVLPTPTPVAAALDAYLDETGRTAGPLIRSRDGHSGIGSPYIGQMTRRWLREAGVKVRPLDGRSAHGLRRTAASDVMERTGDIVAVQEMLGHADVSTTARFYLRRRSVAQLREAMEGRRYDAA